MLNLISSRSLNVMSAGYWIWYPVVPDIWLDTEFDIQSYQISGWTLIGTSGYLIWYPVGYLCDIQPDDEYWMSYLAGYKRLYYIRTINVIVFRKQKADAAPESPNPAPLPLQTLDLNTHGTVCKRSLERMSFTNSFIYWNQQLYFVLRIRTYEKMKIRSFRMLRIIQDKVHRSQVIYKKETKKIKMETYR